MRDLYYIQNRGYCGDCLLWWKSDRCGYTMDLDQALKLPKDEAKQLCKCRVGADIAWLATDIDALAQRHVNSELMPKKGATP